MLFVFVSFTWFFRLTGLLNFAFLPTGSLRWLKTVLWSMSMSVTSSWTQNRACWRLAWHRPSPLYYSNVQHPSTRFVHDLHLRPLPSGQESVTVQVIYIWTIVWWVYIVLVMVHLNDIVLNLTCRPLLNDCITSWLGVCLKSEWVDDLQLICVGQQQRWVL